MTIRWLGVGVVLIASWVLPPGAEGQGTVGDPPAASAVAGEGGPPSTETEGEGATGPTVDSTSPRPIFQDVTESSGVDFRGPFSPEKKFILESVSGGVALLDYDRDGLLDLYLVGSLTVATADRPELAPSVLYRNVSRRGQDGRVGPLRFDQQAAAGVQDTDWGVGVCVADVDGNGFPDLYVTGVRRNHLFLNRDGKTFDDATETAGVVGGGWSTGCGFADADRDGDLDLFVARYLDLKLDELPAFGEGDLCQYRGIPVQCGPRGLPGLGDLYYRNEGDGTFREVGAEVGLADEARSYGLGVAWLDVDGDGWQDLYVANDTKANYLYLNKKDGTFEESGFLLGVAVSEDGRSQGSMGIAVGDYLNDGWPSLLVTNFSEEYNALYRNHAGGYFSDASFRARLAAVSLRHVGWGTAFADVDNDGWLDLLAVNGHVYPQIDDIALEASAPYRQRRMLFRNLGAGVFEELTLATSPLARETVSRGLAVGDLDNDGRLDLVVSDLDGKAEVLRNETPESGHWLLVQLEGQGKMKDGIGARVSVRTGATTRHRWVRSGTSYLSQHDLRQHFGLGAATEVDAVDVVWPDGSTSKQEKVEVDRLLIVRQHPPSKG